MMMMVVVVWIRSKVVEMRGEEEVFVGRALYKRGVVMEFVNLVGSINFPHFFFSFFFFG